MIHANIHTVYELNNLQLYVIFLFNNQFFHLVVCVYHEVK